MKIEKKLILVTDLDGTFLSPDEKNLTSELYKIIHEHRQNILLIFATGRGYESILPLLDDPLLPNPDYIIADVGSTVLKFSEGGFTPLMPLQGDIAAEWPGRDKVLNELKNIEGLITQEVPQERRCSFLFESTHALLSVQSISLKLGLEVLVSGENYLDVLPFQVSKGSTLVKLLRLEGLTNHNVLVAGDTLNDLSLMTTGFKGVVVGNAEDKLKKAVSNYKNIYIANQSGPLGILEALSFFGFDKELNTEEQKIKAKYGEAELVMVYHRQPFDEIKSERGLIRQYPKSPNGIIPTLLGFFSTGIKGAWVAWSQQESRNPDNFEIYIDVDKEKFPNLIAARVALTQHDVNLFYKKFSKESFWPIIFSFPSRATFDDEHWTHFCQVNQLFAQRAADVAAYGATVWIHDYNLWMTPMYLREIRPDLKIAFFHHTSFPSSDIFSIIPWKREIITSLLKCDYVGFHIPRYVENFIDVVRSQVPIEVLAIEGCAPNYLSFGCALGVRDVTRKIQTPFGYLGLGAHPVGIDNEKIEDIVNSLENKKRVHNLLKEVRDRKIILSVERLDYVKGPIEKMLAFESFLETHPEWHDKVSMINVVPPPAPGMEVYKGTREKLDQVVGRINGRFSKLGWSPVRYFYQSIPFDELISYYVAADIIWITPLRDGLNLVCKEFVSAKAASQTLGVLVLSEFAGASVELKGALLTNPYGRSSLIQGLLSALNMDEDEKKFRMLELIQRVKYYDVKKWGDDFLSFR
jgi:glucosylglycerol-phosphate synthase